MSDVPKRVGHRLTGSCRLGAGLVHVMMMVVMATAIAPAVSAGDHVAVTTVALAPLERPEPPELPSSPPPPETQ